MERKDTARKIMPSHYIVGGAESSFINVLRKDKLNKKAVEHMEHMPYKNDFRRGDI